MVQVLTDSQDWLRAAILAPAARSGSLDLLFAGTETDHRHQVLGQFSKVGGLRFAWMTMLHGRQLAAAVANSSVVLSVANFGYEGENKLPRVLPLMPLGAAVLSESTAPFDDAAWLSDAGAIMTATSQCLPIAAVSLAASPSRRQAMQAAALRASTALPQSTDHSVRKLVLDAFHHADGCDTR